MNEERQNGDIVTARIENLLFQLNGERVRLMDEGDSLREDIQVMRGATVWTRIRWVFKGVGL